MKRFILLLTLALVPQFALADVACEKGLMGAGLAPLAASKICTLSPSSVTLTATLSAEQVTSTDDATITDDLAVGGDLAVTGTVTASGSKTLFIPAGVGRAGTTAGWTNTGANMNAVSYTHLRAHETLS
jgi:hypothetical protein